MARYIDAELFADRLLNAWDTADKEKKSEIVAILSDIVTPILVGTPAADVVPRAEVEKLREAYNYRLAKDIQTNADFVKYTTAEVAREIFEEIEKILDDSTIVSSSDWGRPYFNITNFRYGIFRLKTKYKEGQK